MRNICADDWEHIFSDGKVRSCRWVWDTLEDRLVQAQVLYDEWEEATTEAMDDLEDSIRNANDECLTHPEDWDVEARDDLPEWARASEEPNT
jgi:hypothetical protein